jgi:hypothetical protein
MYGSCETSTRSNQISNKSTRLLLKKRFLLIRIDEGNTEIPVRHGSTRGQHGLPDTIWNLLQMM